MPRTAHALTALALVAGLAACGGDADTPSDDSGAVVEQPSDEQTGTDEPTASDDGEVVDAPDEGATDDADGTSAPADEDLVQQAPGSVTTGEAEAVGGAYLGLTLEEVEAQALIDDRPWRVGSRDGEQFALTEDYVVGRITLDVVDDVAVAVTVEATDGPVTVES